MFNVFSNIARMSDKIRAMQKCAGALYTMALLRGDEDEPLYLLKPKAVYVLTWINKKILYELPNVKYVPDKKGKYIDVRIRIATSMLNKLVDDGIIDKEIGITYHRRLITNVRRILNEINAEDLPF